MQNSIISANQHQSFGDNNVGCQLWRQMGDSIWILHMPFTSSQDLNKLSNFSQPLSSFLEEANKAYLQAFPWDKWDDHVSWLAQCWAHREHSVNKYSVILTGVKVAKEAAFVHIQDLEVLVKVCFVQKHLLNWLHEKTAKSVCWL